MFRDVKASGPLLAVSAMSSEMGEHKINKLLSCMCDLLVCILYTDMYVCVCVYIYIYIMCVYIYIYVCVCVYVCIYIYMYIYTVESRFVMVFFFSTIHFYDPCRVGPSTPDMWCITAASQASVLYLVHF